MKKSILKLERFASNSDADALRTIVKTQHGRTLFLSLEVNGDTCTITDCFYTDRNRGREGVVRQRQQDKGQTGFFGG